MNPIVEAALISTSSVVIVGVLGYVYNRAIAKATIEATNANAMNALDAGHAAQHWEKRAEAYVDAMTAITRRRAGRDIITRLVQIGSDEDQRKALEQISGPPDDKWALASARVTVYATIEIQKAMEASNEAEKQVYIMQMMYRSLIGRSQQQYSPSAPTGTEIAAAFEAVRSAAVAANGADGQVEKLMKEDLERRPSTLLRTDSKPQPEPERAGRARQVTSRWRR